MSTDQSFQPGDLATWDAIPHEVATVLSVTTRGVGLRYPDDDVDALPEGHRIVASACSQVAPTVEDVGRWARITEDDSAENGQRGARGEVVLVEDDGDGGEEAVVIRDAQGRLWTADPGCAVLVAPPEPPALTPAFPFVGARAQVGPNPTYGRVLHCRTIKAGSTVTVLSEPDEQGDVRAQREDGEWSWVAARHLSPVPVSPGPDQPTDCGKCLAADNWRGKPTEHVGPDQPTEHEDWTTNGRVITTASGEVVAAVTSSTFADRVVSDHQDAPALRAEVQRLRADLRRITAERAAALHDVSVAESKREKARAERDAARAELAAAHNTDGLGLPQVEVVVKDGVACAFVDGKEVATDLMWPHLHLQQRTAAVALALLRARLADEATTEDKNGQP